MNPTCFIHAAETVEAGAEPNLIAREFFQSRSLPSLRLEQLMLSRMMFFCGGAFVCSYLKDTDFEKQGAIRDDAEILIDILRGIAGVRVALILKENGKARFVEACVRRMRPMWPRSHAILGAAVTRLLRGLLITNHLQTRSSKSLPMSSRPAFLKMPKQKSNVCVSSSDLYGKSLMTKRGSSGLSLLLAIDKPKGMTSHDVVNRVRRVFGEKRVGHMGTLDPLASGVLCVAVGPATRLDAFMSGHNKTYVMDIAFGLCDHDR